MAGGHLALPFSPAERRACQRAYVDNQGLLHMFGRRMLQQYPYLDKATVYSCIDVAFLKAFRAHDPVKGKFSTIFARFVYGELNHWVRDRYGMIRLPREAQRILTAARKLLVEGHDLADIAVRVECSYDTLVKVLSSSLTPTFETTDPDLVMCPRRSPMEALEEDWV